MLPEKFVDCQINGFPRLRGSAAPSPLARTHNGCNLVMVITDTSILFGIIILDSIYITL